MPILCGTDFSPAAAGAVDVACALARRLGEPLKLLHAHLGLPEDAEKAAGFHSLTAQARKRLEDEAARCRARGCDKVEVTIGAGVPDEVIVEEAERSRPRLVILGSTGAGTRRGWFLGSTAERCAQRLSVPAWVVREPEGLLQRIESGQPLRVVAGADFSETSSQALRWLHELRAIGPSDIRVAYFYPPFEEHQRLGFPVPGHFGEHDPRVEQILVRDLGERLGELPGTGTVSVTAEPALGAVAYHLVSLASELEGDLLVIGARPRHGLERLWHYSVSRGVLGAAPMTVACVPLGTQAAVRKPIQDRVFKTVLAVTDFSEAGNQAVSYAVAAASPGGKVVLGHVLTAPRIPNPLFASYSPKKPRSPEELAESQRHAESQLRDLLPPSYQRAGVQVECQVTEDEDVREGILALAERVGADLICLGSIGLGSLRGVLLGSVAQRILRDARCPVLVVPGRRAAR